MRTPRRGVDKTRESEANTAGFEIAAKAATRRAASETK